MTEGRLGVRIVVQRVIGATLGVVEDDGEREHARIGAGLVALVGVEKDDTPADLAWGADKLVNLRIFEDDAGKMNLSVLDVKGAVLLVPNFTVAGSSRKGRRPSFDTAMAPTQAEGFVQELVSLVRANGAPIESGVFGAHMRVRIENDGPVTIWLDSRER
ncbi:MAG: D-aminoacyl-tRNA deacylase [Phycisphaerales bacterium]